MLRNINRHFLSDKRYAKVLKNDKMAISIYKFCEKQTNNENRFVQFGNLLYLCTVI